MVLEVTGEKVTKSFQLVAAHPVLDLVNTLDWRFRESGPEELLNSYDDLLGFAEQSGLLSQRMTRVLRRAESASSARALQQAKDLRESAAQLLYAMVDHLEPPIESVLKLDRYLHAMQANRSLRWTPSGIKSLWPSEDDPRLPLWLLTQSAADLVTSEAADSVRACAAPGCRWLFLDASRNHTRRWCDMKICGNRMKARRFKAQQRAE
jgi:predicted RNA-binding Zn ribbon-like protein